jgi:hypothetical protein
MSIRWSILELSGDTTPRSTINDRKTIFCRFSTEADTLHDLLPFGSRTGWPPDTLQFVNRVRSVLNICNTIWFSFSILFYERDLDEIFYFKLSFITIACGSLCVAGCYLRAYVVTGIVLGYTPGR